MKADEEKLKLLLQQYKTERLSSQQKPVIKIKTTPSQVPAIPRQTVIPQPQESSLIIPRFFNETMSPILKIFDVMDAPRRIVSANLVFTVDAIKQKTATPDGVSWHEAMIDALANNKNTKYSDYSLVGATVNTLTGGIAEDAVKLARKRAETDPVYRTVVTIADASRIAEDIAVGLLFDAAIGKAVKTGVQSLYKIKMLNNIKRAEQFLATTDNINHAADYARKIDALDNKVQYFKTIKTNYISNQTELLNQQKTISAAKKALKAINDADVRKAITAKLNDDLVSTKLKLQQLDKEYVENVLQQAKSLDQTIKEATDTIDLLEESKRIIRNTRPDLQPAGVEELAEKAVRDAYKLKNLSFKEQQRISLLASKIPEDVAKTKTGKYSIAEINRKIDWAEELNGYLHQLSSDVEYTLQRAVLLNSIDEWVKSKSALSKIRPKKKAISVNNIIEGKVEDIATVKITDITKELPKEESVASAFKLQRSKLNEWAKIYSYGKASKYTELDNVGLRILYDYISDLSDVPRTVEPLKRLTGVLSPRHKAFERLGMRKLWEDVNDIMFDINKTAYARDNDIKDGIRAYNSISNHKWSKPENQIAAFFADNGIDAPLSTKMQALVDKYRISDDALQQIKNMVKKDKEYFDWLADVAIERGLMTKDPVKAAEKGLPLYVETYYSHKNILKSTISNYLDEYGSIDIDLLFGRKIRMKNVPSTITINEFKQRTIPDALFSNDWYSVSSQAFKSELKKLFLEPVLKRGSAFINVLPDSRTKLLLREYYANLARDVRGMEKIGTMDEVLNRAFRTVSEGVEKVAGKIGLTYQAGNRDWEKLANAVRRSFLRGTMHLNTRAAFKNMFQSLHSINTIGASATLKGIESSFTKGGRRLLNYYPTAWGRIPLEGWGDKSLLSKLDAIGTFPTTSIERFVNVASAGNGAVWKIFSTSDKHMAELLRFALKRGYTKADLTGNKFWDIVADAVDSGLFKDVIKLADANIMATQWSYHSYDMPQALSTSTGKLIGMFQSWNANFWFNHMPTLWKQLIKGESVLSPAIGKLSYTNPQRYAILGYASLIGMLYYLGRKYGIDMSWMTPVGQYPSGRIFGKAVPFPVSPPISTALDTSAFIFDLGEATVSALEGNDFKLEESGKRLLEYDVFTGVPFGLQIRRVARVATGKEKPISLILGTLKENKRKKQPAFRKNPYK